MFTHLTDLIIKIDIVLLAAALALSVIIILYAVSREAKLGQRRRHLQAIQQHLLEMTRSGQEPVKENMALFINGYTPQDFINLARDKELEVTPELEQKIRDHFSSDTNTEQIEAAARKPANKWQGIEAIISLGYINSPNAVEILKESLYSKDEDISYYALRSLEQIKNNTSARILLDFLGTHANSGYNIALALETFPPEVAEELFRSLDSQYQAVRFWALKVINKLKFMINSNQIAEIIKLSQDDNADVRAAACECLGGLYAPEIKDTLIERLNDKFWFVRMHAVRALENILGPLSLPLVAKLIKDPSWKVKEAVKSVMAHNILESLPFIEDILARVSRSDEPTSRACADALIDSGYILTILKNLLSGEKPLEEKARYLLAGLIRSKVYFGLKKALENFELGEQNKLLQVINALDRDTARRIAGEFI
ncbi:MAG: HEAT repeat domain-containing protein [bacterium]|nr:HEAT repeat domain-containing protein [bacterium]MDD5354484.1 HEAT repeat domain-containing protein [bacterium]MDD5757217.1 HEAT repeat domain-containing protein [bacterium]